MPGNFKITFTVRFKSGITSQECTMQTATIYSAGVKTKIMNIRLIIKVVLVILIVQLFLVGCSTYKSLDKAFANPNDVVVLKIKNTKIQELPPEIGTLKNLKTLYLFRIITTRNWKSQESKIYIFKQ